MNEPVAAQETCPKGSEHDWTAHNGYKWCEKCGLATQEGAKESEKPSHYEVKNWVGDDLLERFSVYFVHEGKELFIQSFPTREKANRLADHLDSALWNGIGLGRASALKEGEGKWEKLKGFVEERRIETPTVHSFVYDAVVEKMAEIEIEKQ